MAMPLMDSFPNALLIAISCSDTMLIMTSLSISSIAIRAVSDSLEASAMVQSRAQVSNSNFIGQPPSLLSGSQQNR
ncbi:MAG: hypothetical protein GX153_00130 [Clostridiaceae bacterium]|nr:hypothetical protein [Clostridiaceae bacterium]